MKRTTCTTPDCEKPSYARGLCAPCYGRRYRAGDLPPRDRSEQHRISDADPDSRTGVCSICGPVDIRVRPDRRGAECMVKRREYGRAWGKRRSDGELSRHRQRKYKLSEEGLASLKRQAGGSCLICNTPFGDDGYHVDHCHETGVVRGLLCRRCNYALGWLNDDPARVMAAYFYLVSGGRVAP